LKADRF
jgi:hypothetical protein